MRRILQLPMLGLAAGALFACKPEEVIETEQIPTAGIRFINAVPDTGSMDFRPVDIVENTTFYNVTFRSTSILYYKNARAGTRHFKIFRTPDLNKPAAEQIATASTVVADLADQVLEAGKRYTYILWGNARGNAPAMRVTVITDDPADPATQVAVRVINACVPGLCGASADGNVDARVFTSSQTINSPATTWTGVAPLSSAVYRNIATATGYTFDFRPAGGATAGAALASGTGQPGTAQTVDLDAIPGTNVAGSGISAILMPRSLAGSTAANFPNPGVTFVWDKRPPRTCALCAPAQ